MKRESKPSTKSAQAKPTPEQIKAQAIAAGLRVCDGTNEVLAPTFDAVASDDYGIDNLRGYTLLLDHIEAHRLNLLQDMYFLDQVIGVALRDVGRVLEGNNEERANCKGVAVGFLSVIENIVEDAIKSGRAAEIVNLERERCVEFLRRDFDERLSAALVGKPKALGRVQ